MLVRALLVRSSAVLEKRLEEILAGADVFICGSTGREGLWEALAKAPVDMIIAERAALPEPVMDTIGSLRSLPGRPRLVLLDGRESPADLATAVAAGADVTLRLDLPDSVLADALRTLIAKRRESALLGSHVFSPESQPSLDDFVSRSDAMRRMIETARRVAASDSSLLLLGETGVGKERLARAIHRASPRTDGPFVAVNCAAIPESLIESELFGHEKGAFTGAEKSRRGHFELAHRGSFFLDEIGDLPQHLQTKLLRVLQDRQVVPLGAERAVGVDVRIMAATNSNLLESIEAKRFRSDLYYRLSVVTLTIPPLRERPDDILPLAEAYLHYFAGHLGREVNAIAAEAAEALVCYDWPGNVRELANVIEHAVLLSDAPTVKPQSLPLTLRPAGDAALAGATPLVDAWTTRKQNWLGRTWREVRDEVLRMTEREYLTHVLRSTGGRVGEAARIAGMDPRSLFDKLKAHGIRKEEFKPDVQGRAEAGSVGRRRPSG